MAKQLKNLPTSTVAEYFEDHMSDGKHDLGEMFSLYVVLMNRKNIYGIYKPMKLESLRKRLVEIAGRKDSFLLVKHERGKRMYVKKVEPAPTVKDYLDGLAITDKIKMSPLYKKANEIYAKGIKRAKSCRK